jgi:Zn-dependent M16 (insulinase) family peptidase
MDSYLNKVGQKYNDFEVVRVVDLPEIHCQLNELIHLPTGAKVMHIANDDPENVFCLSFQTIPENSKGAAHILEHTVLCGSQKFPVKDPFFAMIRRSLNTFMNAFTGADFTCYPAASQVSTDFYNLLDVYLDAVFYPNLKELSFLQEGHRLEFSEPTNIESPLEHKGIVFNEMKGAMATPDSRLDEALHSSLFPDLTYGHNFGGNPEEIPGLTYQELLNFHQTFYHPSQCLFFFYGNLPIQPHLDFILANVLKNIKKAPPLPSLPRQPRFTSPKATSIFYPLSPDEDLTEKALIAFGWLTCHILEQKEVLALSMLAIILMGTDASPLKKALLRSALCKHATLQMDPDCTEVPITITLRGCNPENREKLEEIIRNTLKSLVETGISPHLIENAIHQVEFHRSEIGGNHHPYGLALFLRAGLIKQHGGNPEENLKVHSLCDALRKKAQENPRYFLDLITKYLLDNTHFVKVTAIPNTELATKEAIQERERLDAINKNLTFEQKRGIVEQTKDLAEFQQEQASADIDILPKITLAEVPKKVRHFSLEEEKIENLTIFYHNYFTNDIIYADLLFPLPFIDEKELPLIKLFSLIVPQVGSGERSYSDSLEYIQAYTGGIGASQTIFLQANDRQNFSPAFLIHGKALHRNADKLFMLLKEMTVSLDFRDFSRLKEVIIKHFAVLQSTLTQNALKYAIHLSSSRLGIPYRLGNAWGGLEYYWFVRDLVANLDTNIELIAEQLTSLKNRILGLADPHLVLTCDKAMYQELKKQEFFGLQNLSMKANTNPWKDNYIIPSVHSQGRVISSPVAFTCNTFPSLSYNDCDTPALSIAAHLFDNLVLHSRIREQGGAYGSGATNHTLSGYFCFYSYRDPNISTSLAAFEEAILRIVNGNFKDSDLEEAKLEIIQGLDNPIAPGSRAHVAYSWMREGKTQEVRQKFRDCLIGATRDDVISATKTHIVPNYTTGAVVVFAGKELLEKENVLLLSQGKMALALEQI